MSESIEYSVGQISVEIKRLLQCNYENIKIRGEISGYKGPYRPSGHVYFALKEENAKIDAIIWNSVFNNLAIELKEGMEIVAYGDLSAYAPSSKYNFHIKSVALAGQGSLMARFEQLKKKLREEGIFDERHKKTIPFMPKRIGIITASEGAVIRDIIHRIAERMPSHLLLWEVPVQGEKCAAEVSRAIKGFNKLAKDDPTRPDLIIVARGGGSIEDLWGFNDEIVVRSAFSSEIPIISAIGHETDFTLLDLVADKRAPTPTAAAEICTPALPDLLSLLDEKCSRLCHAAKASIVNAKQHYKGLVRAIPKLEQLLSLYWQRYDNLSANLIPAIGREIKSKRQDLENTARFLGDAPQFDNKTLALEHKAARLQSAFKAILLNKNQSYQNLSPLMGSAIQRYLKDARQKLLQINRLLDSMSYNAVLQRGYAMIFDSNGDVITSSAKINSGQLLNLKLSDGEVMVEALDKNKK